jgi:hypothetical protein
MPIGWSMCALRQKEFAAKLANWLRAAADEVNRERAIDIRTAKKPMAAGKHMLKGIASRFLEDLE